MGTPSLIGGPCLSTTSIMKNHDEASTSDVTLTPGTDGVSDYQQYLEKTSQRDSRGDASLVHASPTGDGEILRHNCLMDSPATELDNGIRLGIPSGPTLEGLRPADAPEDQEQRPHRMEVTEDPHEYPGPLALSLLTIGICLSVFLVSLDRTIVATVRVSCWPLGIEASRLISLPSRPYRALPTISIPPEMLGGTAAPTWLPLALSSPFTGVYSSCSI